MYVPCTQSTKNGVQKTSPFVTQFIILIILAVPYIDVHFLLYESCLPHLRHKLGTKNSTLNLIQFLQDSKLVNFLFLGFQGGADINNTQSTSVNVYVCAEPHT